MLIGERRSILPEQSGKRTPGDPCERPRSLVKTFFGVGTQRGEFTLEPIATRSAVYREQNEAFGGALQQAAAGQGFVIRMRGEHEDPPEIVSAKRHLV